MDYYAFVPSLPRRTVFINQKINYLWNPPIIFIIHFTCLSFHYWIVALQILFHILQCVSLVHIIIYLPSMISCSTVKLSFIIYLLYLKSSLIFYKNLCYLGFLWLQITENPNKVDLIIKELIIIHTTKVFITHSYHKGFQQLIQGRKQFFSLCLVSPENLPHGCRVFSHLWFYKRGVQSLEGRTSLPDSYFQRLNKHLP